MSDRQKRGRPAVGDYALHAMRLIGAPHDRVIFLAGFVQTLTYI
jgi:hypothetical protein